MTSVRADLLIGSLRARRSKKFYADPATMRSTLAKHQKHNQTEPTRTVRRNVRLRQESVEDMRCYVLAPAGDGARGARTIMHLHGGAFVEQPEPYHWRFLRWLVEHADATVVFPIYPLCPTAEHPQIRDCVKAAYDRFLAGSDGGRYVFGDSSGGALAVDLVETLRAGREPVPTALGLLSPWLDLAVSAPRSAAIDPTDPELAIAGLRQTARWYAAGEPLDDPGISPLYADFSGFPPMSVFTGTRDILNPDARRVRDAASGSGVRVDFHEYDGMFHNWTMRQIPEGAEARSQLLRFMESTRPTASPVG